MRLATGGFKNKDVSPMQNDEADESVSNGGWLISSVSEVWHPAESRNVTI